jgi:hypothetical protein
MGTTITDPVEFLDDGTIENVKHEICRAVLGKDGSLNIDCSDRGCGSPMDTTPSRRATEPWMSELFPEPATPVSTVSTPSGCRRPRA